MFVAIYWCELDHEWSVTYEDKDYSDQVAEASDDPVLSGAGALAVKLNQAHVVPQPVQEDEDQEPLPNNVINLFRRQP